MNSLFCERAFKLSGAFAKIRLVALLSADSFAELKGAQQLRESLRLSVRLAVILALLGSISACSSLPELPDKAEAHPRDPFEPYNRRVFAFNEGLDNRILKPTAKAYRFITPDNIEYGVTNFFENLEDAPNTIYNLLQGKFGKAGNDGSRFLINSTFGILGFFDVASKWGLERNLSEDLGQTLVHWGVPDGPYLMWPIIGPSTVTDTIGLAGDVGTNPLSYLNSQTVEWSLRGLEVVDTRARLLGSDFVQTNDTYLLVRDAYLQRREYKLNDGVFLQPDPQEDVDDGFTSGYMDDGFTDGFDEYGDESDSVDAPSAGEVFIEEGVDPFDL